MAYKIKFRVIGDKPPFTVTLHEDAVINTPVISKIITSSNVINYLNDTESYTISPAKEYCVKAVDSINNNVYVCDIEYPDIPPYVVNVTCGGQLLVGSLLSGSYQYYDDNGDVESGSIFKWYRSDNAQGTNKIEISGAITQQYTLTNDDIGKYIQFSVTPKNIKATGDEGLSINRGPIVEVLIPQITDFTSNSLIWSMSDNTQSGGSWQVEYSLNGGTSWISSVGGGSPHQNLLPYAIYNQTISFRVKRVSTPITEYSNVFSKMVYQIHNYSQSKTGPVNVFPEGSTVDPPPGFCIMYTQYTTGYIYLENQNTEIQAGTQLYFKANDGIIRPATQNNINTYESSYPLVSGITHIFFIGFNNQVWDVNPVSGQLIRLSSSNGMCNP